MDGAAAPVREPRAVAVYKAIKDAIITCALAPGSVVAERELAQQYDVSKTPVREALNRLREEGLVQSSPHKGTVISPITVQDIQDTYYLRLLLEPEAASLACRRATPAQVREVRELYRRMSATSPTRQRAKQLRYNTEFHLAIARASGNPKLADALHSLLIDVERFYNAHHAQGGPRPAMNWDALVEAIATGDATAARAITVEGIRSSRRRLTENLIEEPGGEPVAW